MKKLIETKKDEIRGKTSDPKRMIGKFLASRVLKTWTEDFIDEDTNEVVSIERNEVLFEKGIYIDNDKLSQIQFYIQAGDIKEVEVSNQKRIAYQEESTYLHPFIAQAEMIGKKYKFLLYASRIDTAMLVLNDYLELNYFSPFSVSMLKEFEASVILTDNLKEKKEESEEELDYEKTEEKKFYQIDVIIEYGDDYSTTGVFVVNTLNVDRAMMLINDYLQKKEEKIYKEAKEKGNDYTKQDIRTMIESAKPIPVGVFIPKEFSEAYIQA